MPGPNPKFPRTIDFNRQQIFGTLPIANGGTGLPAAITADVDGSTITLNLNLSSIHTVTLAANRTLALSGGFIGQCFLFRPKQDGTGSRTITWFTTINWAGGSPPTLTATFNKADLIGFLCTAANTYDGFILGQNI